MVNVKFNRETHRERPNSKNNPYLIDNNED